MLPVFLDCPILIAPSVFSNVYFEVRIDEDEPNIGIKNDV
jgi:hypothetical protein